VKQFLNILLRSIYCTSLQYILFLNDHCKSLLSWCLMNKIHWSVGLWPPVKKSVIQILSKCKRSFMFPHLSAVCCLLNWNERSVSNCIALYFWIIVCESWQTSYCSVSKAATAYWQDYTNSCLLLTCQKLSRQN